MRRHTRFVSILGCSRPAPWRWWTGSSTSLTSRLPLGLFGASTGAAAALIAAAERPERVRAVVSRGGRPDLADEVLSRVVAPTLLIVGGYDHAVLELNQLVAQRLRCPHSLEIVVGATHLFEEPGKLERAAGLTTDFFQRHLVAGGA